MPISGESWLEATLLAITVGGLYLMGYIILIPMCNISVLIVFMEGVIAGETRQRRTFLIEMIRHKLTVIYHNEYHNIFQGKNVNW